MKRGPLLYEVSIPGYVSRDRELHEHNEASDNEDGCADVLVRERERTGDIELFGKRSCLATCAIHSSSQVVRSSRLRTREDRKRRDVRARDRQRAVWLSSKMKRYDDNDGN